MRVIYKFKAVTISKRHLCWWKSTVGIFGFGSPPPTGRQFIDSAQLQLPSERHVKWEEIKSKKERKRGGTEPCREFGSSYQQPLSLCLSVIYSGSEFIIRARRRNVCPPPPPPADKPINDFVLSDDNTRSLGGTRKEMQRGIAHERTAGVDVDTRRGILYSSALGNELLILSLSLRLKREREPPGQQWRGRLPKRIGRRGEGRKANNIADERLIDPSPLLFASSSSSSFLSIASTSDPMQPVTCILVCSSSFI